MISLSLDHMDRLIGRALQRWRDDRDWDDLQQEARIRAWIDLQRLPAGSYPAASIVVRAARWAAVDYFRRRNRFPLSNHEDKDDWELDRFQPSRVSPWEAADPWRGADDRLTAAQFLARMLPRERQAALLYYWRGWTFEEVGAALGVTNKRAYQILQTGLDRSRWQFGLPRRGLNRKSPYRRRG
jgi:RNA polymerase sigma factor (sigma-70 family)